MTNEFDFLFSETQQTQNVFTLFQQGTIQDTNGFGKRATELKLGKILLDNIQTNFAKVSKAIAPIARTENNTIKYTKLILDKPEADYIPESGMARAMKISWLTGSETIEKKGLSFRITRQKLESSESKMIIAEVMSKMSETIAYSVDSDSIYELMRQRVNFMRQLSAHPISDNAENTFKRHLKVQHEFWAATAQNDPLRSINRYANMQISAIGGKETMVIMDYRTADMIANHKNMLEVYQKGELAELNLANGVGALASTGILPTREPVIKLKSHKSIFERDDIRVSPLECIAQHGEFFISRSIKPGEKGNIPYESRQMDIQIYNEESNQFETIQFLEALKHSGRFNSDGKLVGPNTINHSKQTIPLNSSEEDKDKDPFEFEFQIFADDADSHIVSQKDLTTYRKAASLIGNIDLDREYFGGFASSIIDNFLKISRLSEREFFSIWNAGMKSYDRLTLEPCTKEFELAVEKECLNGKKLVWNPDKTFLTLPDLSKGIGAHVKGFIPFGFGCLAGMKEIARHVSKAEAMGYDSSLFESVAAFVSLFKDFVEYLVRIFPQHPMLDPMNIAPHAFENHSSEYVFFSNLFASSREFNVFLLYDGGKQKYEELKDAVKAAFGDKIDAVLQGYPVNNDNNARKDFLDALRHKEAKDFIPLVDSGFGETVQEIAKKWKEEFDFNDAIAFYQEKKGEWKGAFADTSLYASEEIFEALTQFNAADQANARGTMKDEFKKFMKRIHGKEYDDFATEFEKTIEQQLPANAQEKKNVYPLILLYQDWKESGKSTEEGGDAKSRITFGIHDQMSFSGILKQWKLVSIKNTKTIRKLTDTHFQAWSETWDKWHQAPVQFTQDSSLIRTPLVWTPQTYNSLIERPNQSRLFVPSSILSPFQPEYDQTEVKVDEFDKSKDYKEYYNRLNQDYSPNEFFAMSDLNEIKKAKSISCQMKFPAIHSAKMIGERVYKPRSPVVVGTESSSTAAYQSNHRSSSSGGGRNYYDRGFSEPQFVAAKKQSLLRNRRNGGASSSSSSSGGGYPTATREARSDDLRRIFGVVDSTLPAKRDEDYLYDTLSSRFLNLLFHLSLESKTGLERALSIFGAFVQTTYGQFALMYEADIRLPVEAILSRPFKRYRALSVIKTAPNIGTTYYKPAVVQLTADANGDLLISASLQYKSVFTGLENTFIMTGSHIVEPLAGCGTGFFKSNDGITNFDQMSKNPQAPSLISILLPYGRSPKRSSLDITGYFNIRGAPLSSRVFEGNDKPHYPTYKFIKEQFLNNLDEEEYMMLEFDPQREVKDPLSEGINTLNYRGLSIHYQGKDKRPLVVLGDCPWGHARTTFRAREVRYGGAKINEDFWINNPGYEVCNDF